MSRDGGGNSQCEKVCFPTKRAPHGDIVCSDVNFGPKCDKDVAGIFHFYRRLYFIEFIKYLRHMTSAGDYSACVAVVHPVFKRFGGKGNL